MIELSSTRAVLAGMAWAKEIAVEAYTLHGPVLRAAEDAARRGAHVVVRLAGKLDDRNRGLASENARVASELRAAGAEATLEPRLHAKEISVDGARYFDGKNWRGDDLVLRDRDPAGSRGIAQTKLEALRGERELLRGARAGDRVVVESESFGCCNDVFYALRELGRGGAAPRLLVSARDLRGNDRERCALDDLVSEGVRVRVCRDSEKLAVAGDRAWLGSANATVAVGKWNAVDWGLQTTDAPIASAVRSRLEAQWSAARDFEPRRPR
jgi:hypothetical protein